MPFTFMVGFRIFNPQTDKPQDHDYCFSFAFPLVTCTNSPEYFFLIPKCFVKSLNFNFFFKRKKYKFKYESNYKQKKAPNCKKIST